MLGGKDVVRGGRGFALAELETQHVSVPVIPTGCMGFSIAAIFGTSARPGHDPIPLLGGSQGGRRGEVFSFFSAFYPDCLPVKRAKFGHGDERV